MKKMDLQREGFNPQVIEDRMFFYDVVKGAYRQLDACLYNDIVEMRCRLWHDFFTYQQQVLPYQLARKWKKDASQVICNMRHRQLCQK